MRIPKVLFPSIVGVIVYMIINKFFPENVGVSQKDPLKDLRGGSRVELAKRIAKILLKNRALKIALITIFATAGIQHFESEIEALLVDDVFKHLCVQNVDGELKLVCNIIQEHELDLHTKSMKSLIVSNNIGVEEKISLLKIKLNFIINGECAGKRKFLVTAILAIIITVTVSGVGGLAMILEALRQLFEEGKVSKALYKQLVKALVKRWGAKIPIEHFID
jgi:hypothetical protein